jgi:AAA15 family ATPase/GTPase
MIKEVKIENYKSIEKISLKPGRITVLVGENGSGKSNLLEAIALTSAATQNRFDNEFLSSRGIRLVRPELMRSGFDGTNLQHPIKLWFTDDKFSLEYIITNDNKPYSNWECIQTFIPGHDEVKKFHEQIAQKDELSRNKIESFLIVLEKALSDIDENQKSTFIQEWNKSVYLNFPYFEFKDFIIYSPENSSLRTFEREGQIEPLGIKGEGLFKLLKLFASQPERNYLNELKKYLKFFDWFDDFSVPERLFEGESFLQIKDKFLASQIDFIDQKSTNEGFLFVLFYISLMICDKTPSFFAIDNIEASLNPKLCTKLIKSLAELAVKYNKQVILTTHNPSVLDGLDLNDELQKLFLVYRNRDGKTISTQIEKPKPIEGQQPIKLSEAFLRGYIGGLPKNFSI